MKLNKKILIIMISILIVAIIALTILLIHLKNEQEIEQANIEEREKRK